jgi:hypothetical protein
MVARNERLTTPSMVTPPRLPCLQDGEPVRRPAWGSRDTPPGAVQDEAQIAENDDHEIGYSEDKSPFQPP